MGVAPAMAAPSVAEWIAEEWQSEAVSACQKVVSAQVLQ
jgi:hypothetical protein